jgi:large conductance mechanosensitive channel
MLKEFREFALKGNMIDMAVGIIIGAAFGTIVNSLVTDVIMPPIGLLLGGVDFTNLFWLLDPGTGTSPFTSLAAAQEAGAVTINYGIFFNSVISFLVVSLVLFFLIRNINRLKREEAAPPEKPTTKDCSYCFSEIAIQATRCAHCTSQLEVAQDTRS